ncbi:MAG: phosphoribosylformylglycinamidine synthase I [Candidatus Marinimicrobia bacterium]|nr:phosphoribosylformylglycinamidine synthase I [Candidatus Neomarinimicrobiota bacterium]
MITKIAIIQFPGSNTERETVEAVKRVGMTPVEFLWNDNPKILADCDGYIIVGGFSYEDRSRAGVIAALDPVIEILKSENETGKPLLGICNGAQILVESGIVPGVKDYRLGMALTDNKRISNGHVVGTGYYNAWANLKLNVPPQRTAFTSQLKLGDFIRVPFAHAEGRFLVPETLLQELIKNDQTVFCYCDDNGDIISDFPVNPNGSIHNLAAVSNPAGTAMAIMPHPERTPNGDSIFASMKTYIESEEKVKSCTLKFDRPHYEIKPYQNDKSYEELFIDLIITDNEALSVQNALRKTGYPITITKNVRWGITTNRTDKLTFFKELAESGELYNSNKERVIKKSELPTGTHFYVQQKEDMIARKTLENISDRMGIRGVLGLEKGIVWTVSSNDGNDDVIQHVIDSHIFFNPLSHDCYSYE